MLFLGFVRAARNCEACYTCRVNSIKQSIACSLLFMFDNLTAVTKAFDLFATSPNRKIHYLRQRARRQGGSRLRFHYFKKYRKKAKKLYVVTDCVIRLEIMLKNIL